MSRNSSGTYTLPAGNPVVANTLIETNWANPTMADIAAALTESLDRYGRGGMLAPLKLADGTVTVPAFAFNSEAALGLYRPSAGILAVAAGGAQIAAFAASGMTINALTISGGTANGVAYLNGSKALTTGTALVFDGTNLGIQVSAPLHPVHVAGSVAVNQGAGTFRYVNSAGGTFIGDFNAADTAGTLVFRNTLAAIERMRIEPGGNVGIGTATPGARLHVAGGDVRVSQPGAGDIGFNWLRIGGVAADWYAYLPSGLNAWALFGSGAERVRVDTTGVGLGGVAPTAALDVNGNVRFRGTRVTLGTLGTNAVLEVDGVNGAFVRGQGVTFQTVAGVTIGAIDASGNASFAGLTLSNPLGLAMGGTGATTAAGARTNLGLGTAATAAATDFLSSATPVTIAQGGTNATTAANARTNLGLGTAAVAASTDFLSSATPVTIAQGGTNATTAAAARTNLGLGTAATTAASDYVPVTGGTFGSSFNFTGSLQYGGLEVGFRNIPRNTTAGGVDGQCTAISAGFTLNTGFPGGTARSFYNDSAAAITVTAGGGLTLRLAGTTATGNRTLAARGWMTVWANSTTEYVASGSGVT